MEKVLAALIPVIGVMVIGPLFCRRTSRSQTKQETGPLFETENGSVARKVLCVPGR
jgi:hypothetical protein